MVHGDDHICDECGRTLTNDEVDYYVGICGWLEPGWSCWSCEDCSRELAESQAENV